jgi:hypothetical protein
MKKYMAICFLCSLIAVLARPRQVPGAPGVTAGTGSSSSFTCCIAAGPVSLCPV